MCKSEGVLSSVHFLPCFFLLDTIFQRTFSAPNLYFLFSIEKRKADSFKRAAPGRVAESSLGLWVRCFLHSCRASLGVEGGWKRPPWVVRELLRPGGGVRKLKQVNFAKPTASPKEASQERATKGSGLAVRSSLGCGSAGGAAAVLTEAAGEH